MRDKIMIVGGYGSVGRVIARQLADSFPGKVIVAGRSYKKAEALAQENEKRLIPLEFDLFKNHESTPFLDDVKVVIMCLDQSNTEFVKICISRGIDYIDISASYSFISKVEQLKTESSNSESTVVLSVGIAPGLTNLLTQFSKDYFDKIERANIIIMLGMGEKHGKAAIEWTVNQINSEFKVVEKGELKEVRGYTDGITTKMPENMGIHKAYRFDFTDQHVLPKSLNIPSVSTRLCFDSKLSTGLFAFLKTIGFFNILKARLFKKLFINLLGKVHFGSDIFIAKVDSYGTKDNKECKYECSIVGNKEGEITGKVAAIVATELYTKELPAGLYHIEELFKSTDIFSKVADDIRFYVFDELYKF